MLLGIVDARKHKVYDDIYQELVELAMKDESLRQAFDAWEEMSQSQDERIAYLSRLKYIIDEEANLIGAKFYARENGRKEGKALGVLQTAQNMINKGLSDELITELTNLPLESVQELRKNNKSESSTGL